MRKNELDQPIGEPVAGWTERYLPDASPMIGQYCRIEKLDPTIHGAMLYQALCEESRDENWTYLPYGPFATASSFQQWLVQSAASSDPLFYTIIDAADDRAVGLASFLRIDPVMGSIEIGHIHFSAALQKTALATQAMYLMMSMVFDQLHYRRYEWKCDNLNAPSKKAAKRLGFQHEGLFRQSVIYKGRNRDTAWFSIIDSDWPKIKQAFSDWLRPENFDGQGQQKSRLQILFSE